MPSPKQDFFSSKMFDSAKDSENVVMPAIASRQNSNGMPAEERALQPKDSGGGGLDTQCALHAQYVMQLLQLQRRAGFLCDITIHVRDKSFQAHKPLLAACSLYFRALFADVSTKESTALNLTSLTPTGFEVLLDYIYSGSLAITAENSSEVLSAATCLQMTNVVETCLNFMRSAFRMSKSKDSPTRKGAPIDANGLVESNVPARRNFYQSTSSINSPTMKSKSPLSKSLAQDNLQILCTESINEAEFKSMIIKSSEQIPILHGKQSVLSRVPFCGVDNQLPSTSQLQSVLPGMITRQPRQPTPKEVQQCLASNSSTVECHPQNLTLSKNLLFSSPSTLTSDLINSSFNSSNLRIPFTSTVTAITSTNCEAKSSSTQTHQNGIVTVPNSTLYKSVYSGKDVPTVNSTVLLSHTPERYSGKVQADGLQTNNKVLGNAMVQLTRPSATISPVRYSSDEQGNSVEISSDEESECDAWSADRSVISSSDLSGTPCVAVTPIKTSKRAHSDTLAVALNLARKNTQLAGEEGPTILSHAAPVSKTLSLPSLSDNQSPVRSLSRAHSTGSGRTEVITLEKATSAITALSCSARTSCQVTSPQSSENLQDILDFGAKSTVQKDETLKGDDDTLTCSIGSQVLQKSLLPLKSRANKETNSTSFIPPSLVYNQPTPQSSDSSGETAVNMVKLESCSDDDTDQVASKGFPVPGGSLASHDDLSLPFQKAEGSELSHYSSEGPNDDEEMALDLSMPLRRHSAFSSTGGESSQLEDQPPSHSTALLSDVSDVGKTSSGRHPSDASSLSDPGTQLAVDALSMLKHSFPSVTKTNWGSDSSPTYQQTPMVPGVIPVPLPEAVTNDTSTWSTISGTNQPAEGGTVAKRSAATFSRKPRRTTGGQTCTWPGCGRLFRHRHMYEDHQRMHELGIPASQLRKCYMGARVKKTVREQLEELRTNDNVFEGGGELGAGRSARARKRKSTSDNQETVRKRVNVKDRPGPFLFSQATNLALSSKQTSSRTSANNSLLVNQPASQMVRPPASQFPPSRFVHVMGPDGVIRLAQSSDPPAVPSQSTHSVLQQNIINALQQPGLAGSASSFSATSPSSSQKLQNPVEATLALLGIRAPARRSAPSTTVPFTMTMPASTLSVDQMRRRLAIRETTAGSNPVFTTTGNPASTTAFAPPPLSGLCPGDGRGDVSHPSGLILRDIYSSSRNTAPASSSAGVIPPRSKTNPP